MSSIKGLPAIAIQPFGQTRIRFQTRPARVTLTGSPLISSGYLQPYRKRLLVGLGLICNEHNSVLYATSHYYIAEITFC